MAKYPGLMRRGTRWYLRVKVPADLVEEVDRREIWRSLETGSHRKAVGRYHPRCGARSRRCSRRPAGACAGVTAK